MVKDITKQEVEEMIRRVKGSFAVDGMILDDDDIDRLRRFFSGEITEREAIDELDAISKANICV